MVLEEFIEIIKNTECIIIPHACKKNGLKQESVDSVDDKIAFGMIDVLRSGNFVNFLFEHTRQYYKGSFAKSVLEQASATWISEDEIEQLRTTFEAGITGSDFRFRDSTPTISDKDFTAIWAAPTFRGLELVCLFPENRIRLYGDIIEKHNYISKINIAGNEYFSPSEISLSSGLNSIIGSSASGKTALLHIIAFKVNNKRIKEKKYSFTEDLDVNFFDKDGNPINNGDIKVEVADSLYDKIAKIHESDIKGILELFNYKINHDSQVIVSYESKINNYIGFESQFLEIELNLTDNLQKLGENVKNYILNVKGNQSGMTQHTIVNGSTSKIQTMIDELLSTAKTVKEIQVLIDDLKSKYNEIRFILEKYSILDETQIHLEKLEVNFINLRKKLNRKYLELKKEQIIQVRVNQVITKFNSSIGQKSEYIQRLNKNIVSGKDYIVSQLRSLSILRIRKNLIDLSFPIAGIKEELTNANRNDYLDLEIVIDENIFAVERDSGIIEYERNSTVFKDFKGQNVFESEEIKSLIGLVLSKGGQPIFRKNEIIGKIIDTSCLKLGFPNKEKINISDVSPGDASKIFIDYKFKTDFKNGNFNIVVFDQPENDVDKEFIYKELLKQINELKHETQVILTSHDPLIVINGDSNRIINAQKQGKKIYYSSSTLEEYEENIPITSLVSRFVDGNELAVKKRYELYTGGNAKW